MLAIKNQESRIKKFYRDFSRKPLFKVFMIMLFVLFLAGGFTKEDSQEPSTGNSQTKGGKNHSQSRESQTSKTNHQQQKAPPKKTA